MTSVSYTLYLEKDLPTHNQGKKVFFRFPSWSTNKTLYIALYESHWNGSIAARILANMV